MRMKSKSLCLLVLLILNSTSAFSLKVDSLFIENIMEKSLSMDFSTNEEKLLFFAGSLQGIPYCGGTLDASSEENLVVRTDSLDCTTYVETVIAMYVASKSQLAGFSEFCNALQFIRYRDGVIQGYVSRLHYFSDWVSDNIRKGIVSEITGETEGVMIRTLSLNYMTVHKELYRQLKDNPENVLSIQQMEKEWENYEMPYIPKEILNREKSQLNIDNGDIIALTTNIDGLDVLHLGFAYWIDGKLHLLHASSVKQKVILDEVSLYEYLMKRKRHTGVRVIRIN